MHRDEKETGLSSAATGPHAEIWHAIIGAAIEVHRVLGPGLLESVFEAAPAHELLCQGYTVRRRILSFQPLFVPSVPFVVQAIRLKTYVHHH